MKTSHPWVYVCEVSVLQGLREDCKNFQRGGKTDCPSMKKCQTRINVLSVSTLDAVSIANKIQRQTRF